MFTDAELNVILIITAKADPMAMIADIQSIREKIMAYGREQQSRQMAEAAAMKNLPVIDEAE